MDQVELEEYTSEEQLNDIPIQYDFTNQSKKKSSICCCLITTFIIIPLMIAIFISTIVYSVLSFSPYTTNYNELERWDDNVIHGTITNNGLKYEYEFFVLNI